MPLNLDDLNDAQRQAVLTTQGPLLVLAGAGSGKTRVLTYRIAHLVDDMDISPYDILAITFTNKAAAEMRSRLEGLLGSVRGMWVATFHAMCVRMLRRDADRIGFTRDFVIYDDDDSKRLVKEICADLKIDTKQYTIAGIRSKISAAKNEMVSAAEYAQRSDIVNPYIKNTARVFEQLEQRLTRANAMDFDDLLGNAYRLLIQAPDVLERYQQRFRYILVDEYQDTNHAQYLLVNLLAGGWGNIMVVGDDDQSIYSWRGADISNILDFERDYDNAITIKLEQNYRSTGHILAAANSVVAHNASRKEKRLFTASGQGEKVCAYLASDERDEGRWIASEITRLHRTENYSYDAFAIFYRTNAQSRVLEDMMLRAGIPYELVGGTRFFDRAEIRDCMAYLKLIVNPADDISAKRVVNQPRRGIGKMTIERVENLVREKNITFIAAIRELIAGGDCAPRTRNGLEEFLAVLDEGAHYEGSLRDIVEMVISRAGLIVALEADQTEESQERIRNIREFFGVAAEYDLSHDRDAAVAGEEDDAPDQTGDELGQTGDMPDQTDDELDQTDGELGSNAAVTLADKPSLLSDFMTWVALRSDLDTLGEEETSVTLMTVHSAKGLEFPVVFVAGLEEGIFPHMSALKDMKGTAVEEERRLAYVAITRARERLYLVYAARRSLYGESDMNPVSRFVGEIDTDNLEFVGTGSQGLLGTGFEKRGDRHGTFGSGGGGRTYGRGTGTYGGQSRGRSQDARALNGSFAQQKTSAQQAHYDERKAEETFTKGDAIDHKTFGRGTVTAVDGDTITVHFANGKDKKLLKGFAPIVKIR